MQKWQRCRTSFCCFGCKRCKCDFASNIDPSKSFYQIDFNDAESELISDDGWSRWEHLLDQAAVLVAFEQVGGAQASLDMAKAYAMERYAFGRAIGSYQAIKHKLADMYISLTLAKSNCYYGAWALSSGSSEPVSYTHLTLPTTERV